MGDKTKFIIMSLAGILLVTLFLAWQLYSSKLQITRDRDMLKSENTSLNRQIEESLKENRNLQTRLSSLTMDLDRVSKEKEEIHKKLEFVNKEKEDLANKLKAQPLRPIVSAPLVPQEQKFPSVPVGEDTYWASIIKSKANLEMQLENISNKLKTLEINNEQLKKDKGALGLEIKSLGNDKQELKRQLEYNQKLVDSLAQELVREKSDKFQIQENLQGSLDSLNNENALLKKQLDSLNSRKVELENKLAGMENRVAGLQKEKFDLENKLNVMDSLVKENISQIGSLKKKIGGVATKKDQITIESQRESVELPPIVVRPKAGTKIETLKQESMPSLTGLAGKILSLNKDSNFVIIDLGEDQGLRLGDIFNVYREDKAIATIEVIQIRQNIAACDIKKEIASIKIGDTIR